MLFLICSFVFLSLFITGLFSENPEYLLNFFFFLITDEEIFLFYSISPIVSIYKILVAMKSEFFTAFFARNCHACIQYNNKQTNVSFQASRCNLNENKTNFRHNFTSIWGKINQIWRKIIPIKIPFNSNKLQI